MSDLTLEELSALVGDDVEFWLGNPFVGRDDIAAKVCHWASKVRASEQAKASEWEATANRYAAQFEAEYERAEQVRETASRLRRAKDELVDDRAALRVRKAQLEDGLTGLMVGCAAGAETARIGFGASKRRDGVFKGQRQAYLHLEGLLRDLLEKGKA